MNLLEVKNLSIGYDKLILQKQVSFSLSEGEIFLVKGPNGSGKSTLIKTLLGEVPPLTGNINFSKNHSQIAHLPQIVSYELPVAITIEEILNSYGISPNENINFIDSSFLSKKWSEASGGEKQKALILSRVASGCDVLVLDEPFNHIDQDSVISIALFLNHLIKEKIVKSIIMVSHILVNFGQKQQIRELVFK